MLFNIIFFAIYSLAAFALYRHWQTENQILWWTILASAVLVYLTRHFINNAMGRAVLDAVDDEYEGDWDAAISNPMVSLRDGRVQFWIKANAVVTLVAMVALVVALFTPVG